MRLDLVLRLTWLVPVVFVGCATGVVTPGDPDGGGEEVPTTTTPVDMPGQQPATPTNTPTTPASEDGTAFGGPDAPLMSGVQVVPNRDSAVLVVPVVANAVDYRAYRLPAGATVTSENGGEKVSGTVIHCAGYQQHNDKYKGTRELLRLIEVTDLNQPTDIVIEALDKACPFPGLRASTHQDMTVTIDEVPVADRITFSFYTDAEIRARYGSLVVNGHGPSASLGMPAEPVAPKVLARTTVKVTPTGKATPRTRDFFDDFDGTSGPITLVGSMDGAGRTYQAGRKLSNSKWDFFVFNDESKKADISVERGLMHIALPDWFQDVFATVVAVPRRAAQLSDTAYLHLTFEVASNATSRRYWWVGLCGSETPGATFTSDGHFTGKLVQTPFFYQADGKNVSVDGWNCLQFFPRDGSPFSIGPAKKRTESDVRVMVNTADAGARTSVVNLSPAQYPDSSAKPSWFLQQDASGVLGAAVLDDQMLIAPRTRFDVWVRRDRLVMYVNGQQRICNDFGSHKLTMAEAGVSFAQVLYHSAAERLEFSRSYNDRTGQRYYLENAPYADERDWDNVGYEENMPTPANLDTSKCFVAP